MAKDYMEFMGKIIEGHASPVQNSLGASPVGCDTFRTLEFTTQRSQPKLEWSFTTSAEYEGVSLNRELLSGPDLRSRSHEQPVRSSISI